MATDNELNSTIQSIETSLRGSLAQNIRISRYEVLKWRNDLRNFKDAMAKEKN